MKDPLNNFEWSLLHSKYDERCRGFDNESKYISVFSDNLPSDDRALYYDLINAFSVEQRVITKEPLGIYEALLYWKLYSQSTSLFNLSKWFRQDASKRNDLQEKLLLLFQEIPASLERTPTAVLEMVEWTIQITRLDHICLAFHAL